MRSPARLALIAFLTAWLIGAVWILRVAIMHEPLDFFPESGGFNYPLAIMIAVGGGLGWGSFLFAFGFLLAGIVWLFVLAIQNVLKRK